RSDQHADGSHLGGRRRSTVPKARTRSVTAALATVGVNLLVEEDDLATGAIAERLGFLEARHFDNLGGDPLGGRAVTHAEREHDKRVLDGSENLSRDVPALPMRDHHLLR